MRTFDDWRTTAPEADEERPIPCPVCTGCEYAAPCSEECSDIVARTRRAQSIKRLYRAIHDAVRLAREYRTYSLPRYGADQRVEECVTQINEYRAQIRTLRAA